MSERPSVGVAVIGFGWMGRVHAQAYARVPHHFPDLPVTVVPVAVADDVPGRAEGAIRQFGFASATSDWREVVADPRVAAVSVTAPNFLHREIGAAVAQAGKHLWIEKPVGLSADDARVVATAAEAARVQGVVGFNYRHAPAVAVAREMIADGAIGTVTHARFRLFSDYAASPDGALTWRYERSRGGSGVIGDLASHGVDLVRYLLGEPSRLIADTAVFVGERARPTGATSGHARAEGGARGPVENEDYVAALLRLRSGARVVLEASRVAVGEQNTYGFEVHGTTGALSWDFRRMGARCRHRDELRRPQGDRGLVVPAIDRGAPTVRRPTRRRRPLLGAARGDGRVRGLRLMGGRSGPMTGQSQARPGARRGLDALCSPCHISHVSLFGQSQRQRRAAPNLFPSVRDPQHHFDSSLRGPLPGAPMDLAGPPSFQPRCPQMRAPHEERIAR